MLHMVPRCCKIKYSLTEWQVELASPNSSSAGDISSIAAHHYLLTQGRAWAISITNKSRVSEEISGAFISNGSGIDDNLIYRFASLTLNPIVL